MEMTIEERCKKFATRNYTNSDGEVVMTIVDPEVYNNALVVANTIKAEMIEKSCEWLIQNYGRFDGKVEDFVNDFKKAMEK